VRAALELIIGNAPLRGRMGCAGRRRVEQYFAMDKYIDRVLAVYKKAIEVSSWRMARLDAESCDKE